MPFPNEHAARIRQPGRFVRFARKNDEFGPGIDVIFGILEDGGTEVQAIRFRKDRFTVEQARAWLKDNDFKPILFEPAEDAAQESTQEVTLDALMADLAVASGKPTREREADLAVMWTRCGLAAIREGARDEAFPGLVGFLQDLDHDRVVLGDVRVMSWKAVE